VAALEKKASDIVILDLRHLDAITDFFVICNGDVDQHVRSISKHIEDKVRTELGERVFHREGSDALNWVLLDYVDVVVHIFKPSFRAFYRLDDLWSDAKLTEVQEESDALGEAKPKARATKTKTSRTKKLATDKNSSRVAGKKETKPKPLKKAPAKKTAARPAASSAKKKPAAVKRTSTRKSDS
jgi:ribosome-associated protein